jgi:hypothetical protein
MSKTALVEKFKAFVADSTFAVGAVGKTDRGGKAVNIESTDLTDGRYFIRYRFNGQDWSSVIGENPEPMKTPRIGEDRSSELRWNPLLGEWVVTAVHRQNRTFMPPAGFCPFCPESGPGT